MPDRAARSSLDVYVVSAIVRMLKGKDAETAREGVAKEWRWLSAEQLDEIMGRALSGIQKGEAFSRGIEELIESEGEAPFQIVETEREAVIHVVPIPGNPRTDTRTIYVRLRPGMTLQDIVDEVNSVLEEWDETYRGEFAGQSAWDYSIAYIL